jgi:hypothetical protein
VLDVKHNTEESKMKYDAWVEAHARDYEEDARRDAERDEAIEREEILSAVADVIGPERLDEIVLDVFDSWMRALAAARKEAA